MDNILTQIDDEITDFTDAKQIKVRIVNLELKQENWIDDEKRDFMIFNGRQCYQRVETKRHGKKKFRIDLGYLNAIPERRRSFALNWFGFALITLMISGMAFYSLVQHLTTETFIAGSVALSGLLIGLTSFWFAMMKSSSRLIFTSHYGKAPVLELIDGEPDARAFVTFLEVLQQKIHSYNQPQNSDTRQYLIEELAELRRLQEEGVITSSVFEQAMRRIVKNPRYKV